MYNTKYECRYHKEDVFLETDQITEDEKDYIRSILYKEDFLNIFYIDGDDDFNKFDEVISELYKKLGSCSKLRECMKKVAAKLISENEEHGLCVLYSYDYMYLTHKCISNYLEHGTLLDEDYNKLINLIDKN